MLWRVHSTYGFSDSKIRKCLAHKTRPPHALFAVPEVFSKSRSWNEAEAGFTLAPRSLTASLLSHGRVALAAVRVQARLTRHNVEDLMPLFTIPLLSLISLAILAHSGRAEFAGYALVASLLMTMGQMGFFVGSEIVAQERQGQTLELMVASPAPYFVVIALRIFVLSMLGLLAFAETWLMARCFFGFEIAVYHPGVLMAAVLATTFAVNGTALLAAAFFCLARNTRTFQHAMNGPLYLLGGVLVPVTYLPPWLQPASRGVFFYWSADLMRACLLRPAPSQVLLHLVIIFSLGASMWVAGALVLRRVLDHLRREGTVGLS